MPAATVTEAEVPEAFNISCDEDGVPQRELTDFVVTRGSELASVCSLDDPEGADAPARAKGKLRIPGSNASLSIRTGELIEWCIEYGNQPSLWVRSANVWYRLGAPAEGYASTHDLARRRFELCSRIYILATTIKSTQATYKSFVRLLGTEWNDMRAYKERDVLAEREFILAQIETLDAKLLNDCQFFKDLRSKKPSGQGTDGSKPDSKSKGSKKKAESTVTSSSNAPSKAANGVRDASNGLLSNGGSQTAARASGPWVPREDELDDISKDQLMKRLEKVVSTVMKMKIAGPFVQPVNPVTDACPDYLERIKNPMDYGTVRNRLLSGKHYKSPKQVSRDVRLIAKNCILYNTADHPFSRYATELERKFDAQARAAEEAELKAQQKRTSSSSSTGGPTNSKKRRSDSDAGSVTGDATPKTSSKSTLASKVARSKSAKSPSPEAADTPECINSSSGSACGKRARPGSRYCGDECGMAVARKKLHLLTKQGMDVDNYIKTCIGKTLVGLNPLNR